MLAEIVVANNALGFSSSLVGTLEPPRLLLLLVGTETRHRGQAVASTGGKLTSVRHHRPGSPFQLLQKRCVQHSHVFVVVVGKGALLPDLVPPGLMWLMHIVT